MADLINQIVIFLEQIVLAFGYPGMYAVQVLENVLTPIPTEPILPMAGMLAAQGKMNLLAIWAAAVAGSTTGSFILYQIGKRAGEPAVRALIRRWGTYMGMNEPMLDRAVVLFNQYGGWLIFFGRFLPVVRPTLSLVAGMSHLPLRIFIPFTACSTSFAIAIYLILGYILGENWRSILSLIQQFEPLIIVVGVVVGIAVVAYVVWRWTKIRAMRRIPEGLE
ncbi:MAG: DedA family protein [Chloroflexi bacterium]|nr:DedA family protein [Chloroflexota bacterium]MCC6896668.1 DedA family protein [Anaerolineae bacterium]